ncbi:hypothetical protein Tco_1210953 [Tanacetum coccineum]
MKKKTKRNVSDAEIAKYSPLPEEFDRAKTKNKNLSREDSDKDNAKKQKLDDDVEKKKLRDSMDVVPRDDISIDAKSLATKYLIVD